MPSRYRLIRGDTVLGVLVEETSEMFRSEGRFEPSPAFTPELRALFDRTDVDRNDIDDEWDRAFEELHRPGLRIEGIDGAADDGEVLINIDGDRASWRVGP